MVTNAERLDNGDTPRRPFRFAPDPGNEIPDLWSLPPTPYK